MKKKDIRRIIDTAMTVLLPMLMAYSLIGENFHEVVGTLMFVLFIAHHVMNRGWYKALFTPKRAGEMSGGHFCRKGKYRARRIFQTVLDMLLLVFMIAQPISGILMSKHLYTFISVRGAAATAREIHLLCAYWGFMLMSLHAGTHLTAPLGKLSRSRQYAWIATIITLSAVSLYGCYAFVKRQIADYMFLKSAFVFFDYGEPRIYFFLDYIAIMVLFAFLGYLIAVGLTNIEMPKSRKDYWGNR